MNQSPNNRMQRIVSQRAPIGADYSAPRKLDAKEMNEAADRALAKRGIHPRLDRAHVAPLDLRLGLSSGLHLIGGELLAVLRRDLRREVGADEAPIAGRKGVVRVEGRELQQRHGRGQGIGIHP